MTESRSSREPTEANAASGNWITAAGQAPIRSRRAFLRQLAAGAGAAFALSGCSGKPGATSIRFWNGFTGADGRTMLALVQRFNRENEDVYVSMQRIPWPTYYNKLFVAGIDGRAPEVFVSHTSSALRMQQAGMMRPMDDFYGETGVPPSDFDPNVLAAVTSEGHRWSVPLDVHPTGMYVNKALLREAEIDQPPTTRSEFVQMLERVRALPPSPAGPYFGFAITYIRSNCFSLMHQFGGRVLGPDGSPAALASPENAAALQFFRDLIVEELLPSLQNMQSFIGFRQGRIATIWEGIYVLPELVRQVDLELGAAVLPVLGVQPATMMNSHNLCLKGGLEGPMLDAARRFVEFLSDNSLVWATGGQVPARLSLRNTETFREMEAQSTFAKEIPYGVYPPQVPYVFEYESEFDLACDRALRGQVKPMVALEMAAEKIEEARQRYRGIA